jgi:hypothetical protein
MATAHDVEIADRLSRRRARIFPVLGFFFLVGQARFFAGDQPLSRAVDQFKISAWLVWAVALLLALAFAGGHFRGARVRALMEDETTRANRQSAYALGFWAAMLASVAAYVLNMFEQVGGLDAIHLVLTAGVGAAILRFGLLERRSFRNA